MKVLAIAATASVLFTAMPAITVRAEDAKKPAAAAPTPDSLARDIKALEDLLGHHEKDKATKEDAAYRMGICKRLRDKHAALAAQMKDLWADLAGAMRSNDYGGPKQDKNTRIQQDAKFKILDGLDKRLAALAERIDALCPCCKTEFDPKAERRKAEFDKAHREMSAAMARMYDKWLESIKAGEKSGKK